MKASAGWRTPCVPSLWRSGKSTSGSSRNSRKRTGRRCWSCVPEKNCSPCWATDLCRIWAGRDCWSTLALVIDCHTGELLGWHLSRSGKAKTAESALEQALIARYGTLGRVPTPFLLRNDNGLVFTSRSYTALVRGYGLRQEFITPHTPEQNGMVERVIRTLKEQCAHRHRFETLQHASRVIGDRISFYNHRRPHQALGMKTPAATFALAA